jgi:endonuclease/exonuclease/phosphatase family metal-dependent hydrolase
LIIAGDFNDWRNHLGQVLSEAIDVHDVFQQYQGQPARSFPAGFPVLRLDRIYVRGFDILQREVHSGAAWRHISDHAALSAQLKRQ